MENSQIPRKSKIKNLQQLKLKLSNNFFIFFIDPAVAQPFPCLKIFSAECWHLIKLLTKVRLECQFLFFPKTWNAFDTKKLPFSNSQNLISISDKNLSIYLSKILQNNNKNWIRSSIQGLTLTILLAELEYRFIL